MSDTSRTNTFQPNWPVNPHMFVGRKTELEILQRILQQTRAGFPENFIIAGDYGIGKTSLLEYFRHLAQGEDFGGSHVDGGYKFLVIQVGIEFNTTKMDLINSIRISLERSLRKHEPARRVLESIWAGAAPIELEVPGVKIKSDRDRVEEAASERFAYRFADTAKRICGDSKLLSARVEGIIILIDDCNRAKNELQIGIFVKNFLECLRREGCNQVAIGIAGLPEVEDKIRIGDRGPMRMFRRLPLGRLSHAECGDIVDRCISEANRIGPVVEIGREARHLIARLSEGHPHFVQQFGFSAFESAKGNSIREEDVVFGMFQPNGALSMIGVRYFEDDFRAVARTRGAYQVLRILAENPDHWMERERIRPLFQGDGQALSNAIRVLRRRNMIIEARESPHRYRLLYRTFSMWLKIHTSKYEEPIQEAVWRLLGLTSTSAIDSDIKEGIQMMIDAMRFASKGELLAKQGNYEDAEDLFVRALGIFGDIRARAESDSKFLGFIDSVTERNVRQQLAQIHEWLEEDSP